MSKEQPVSIDQALSLAMGHVKAGRYAQAEAVYHAILKHDPDNVDALFFLAQIALAAGNMEKAMQLLQLARAKDPQNSFIELSLGECLEQQGDCGGAAEHYKRVVELAPRVNNYTRLAMCYERLGQSELAQQTLQKGIDLQHHYIKKDPQNAALWHELGLAQNYATLKQDAFNSFKKACDLDSNHIEAQYQLAHCYFGDGAFNDCVTLCAKALAKEPNHANLINLKGMAYTRTGNLVEAEKAYKQALLVSPGGAHVLLNLASVLKRQAKNQEAMGVVHAILALNPNNGKAYDLQAKLHVSEGEMTQAIMAASKAVSYEPDNGSAVCMLFYSLRYVCAWEQREQYRSQVKDIHDRILAQGKRVYCAPLDEVMESMDLERNLAFATSWSKTIEDEVALYPTQFDFSARKTQKKKLVVGYLSNDFRDHAVSYLTRSMFSCHDSSKYHIKAYSYANQSDVECRNAIINSVDEFVEIGHLDNFQAAQKIYDDEVDILIDLNGYTANVRSEIIAQRPAPIQISYLGFIGTSGATFYDYIIGDAIVTPLEHSAFYTEKIIQLPECYQVNDSNPPLSDTPMSRADFGLNDDDVVLCSYNQAIKFEPVMFDVWLNIMKRVPQVKFMIYANNQPMKEHIKDYAKARDVDASRFIFVENIQNDLYLKRIGLADLSLDTRIYNGGTITSNCLYMGVPVITLQGEHFASRMATSILQAHGLGELVTHSLDEYEELAVSLCQDRQRLDALKQKTQHHVTTQPLFNTNRFVKHLESALDLAWERHANGQPPDHIKVPVSES